MKVARLSIANFRGIKFASLLFDGHTLMVGSNNVDKSTICEALDLVLSYDRLNRFPPVDEFDSYNAQYLAPPPLEGRSSSSLSCVLRRCCSIPPRRLASNAAVTSSIRTSPNIA